MSSANYNIIHLFDGKLCIGYYNFISNTLVLFNQEDFMNDTVLQEILVQVTTINTFLQLFCYGFGLFIIVYLGYWFFSRFFY